MGHLENPGGTGTPILLRNCSRTPSCAKGLGSRGRAIPISGDPCSTIWGELNCHLQIDFESLGEKCRGGAGEVEREINKDDTVATVESSGYAGNQPILSVFLYV